MEEVKAEQLVVFPQEEMKDSESAEAPTSSHFENLDDGFPGRPFRTVQRDVHLGTERVVDPVSSASTRWVDL